MAQTINTTLGKTDWLELAEHKTKLVEIRSNTHKETAEHDALSGVIHWIDALQDAAHEEGFPVVFLAEEAEEAEV